jgi:cupin 2 domain-containing protein
MSEARGNLLAHLPAALPEELFERIGGNEGCRIERIVSRGHASAAGFWYDQQEHEWVLLLAGAACLAFEDGRTLELAPGDWVEIPAHCRHRVEWTAAGVTTIWLAVFYRE